MSSNTNNKINQLHSVDVTDLLGNPSNFVDTTRINTSSRRSSIDVMSLHGHTVGVDPLELGGSPSHFVDPMAIGNPSRRAAAVGHDPMSL